MFTKSANGSVLVPSGAQSNFSLLQMPYITEDTGRLNDGQMTTITLLRFAIVQQRLGYQWPVAGDSDYSLIRIRAKSGDVSRNGLILTFVRAGSTFDVDFLVEVANSGMSGATSAQRTEMRALLDTAITGSLTDYAYRARHATRSFARVFALDLVADNPSLQTALFAGGYLTPQAAALCEMVPSLCLSQSAFNSAVGTSGGVRFFRNMPSFTVRGPGVGFTAVWQNGAYSPLVTNAPLTVVNDKVEFGTILDINSILPYVCTALGDQSGLRSRPCYMVPPDVTIDGELTRDQAIAIATGRGWDSVQQAPVIIAHEAIYDEAVMNVAPMGYNANGEFIPPVYMQQPGMNSRLYSRPFIESCSEVRVLNQIREAVGLITHINDSLGEPSELGEGTIALGVHELLNRVGSSGSHASVMSLLLNIFEGSSPSAEDASDVLTFLKLQQRVTQKLILKTTGLLNKKPALTQAENLTAATVGSLAAEISKTKENV